MEKKTKDTDATDEKEVVKTEAEDHKANENAAVEPVPVEGRRDGNGALIV